MIKIQNSKFDFYLMWITSIVKSKIIEDHLLASCVTSVEGTLIDLVLLYMNCRSLAKFSETQFPP